MANATLQMTLDDYQALLNARTKAEQDLAEAHRELAATKLIDPSERLPAITAFARDCLTIARFAVANLPPEMIRGWPWRELIRVADNMHVLPDCSVNDRDMGLDLVHFARDCEQHEIRRQSEPKPTKLTPEDVEAHRARLEADPIAQALMHKMQPTE